MNTERQREYADFVYGLSKPSGDVLAEQTALRCDLWHMALGICGEAGEVADAIKKATVYGQQIDIQNLKEELGDLEFYMERLRQILLLTRDQCIEANMEKLRRRYPNGYTNRDAKERKDKQ